MFSSFKVQDVFYCLFLEVWIVLIPGAVCPLPEALPGVCIWIDTPGLCHHHCPSDTRYHQLITCTVLDMLPECMLFLIRPGTLQVLCHYPHLRG